MSPVIQSDQNIAIKRVRKLQRKKYRDAAGQFIIEGRNLVWEACRKDIVIDTLLIAEDFPAESWTEGLRASGTRVYRVEQHLFERLTEAENGAGLLAVVNYPEVNDAVLARPGGCIVVLDRLQDPGNIGTIIRTAVAAGYDAVVSLKGTADIFSRKVLRATAGMIFDIPIFRIDNPEELLEMLKRYGKRAVVTVPEGGVPYYDVNLSDNVALIVGNEGNGISEMLKNSADERVTIPMCGEIESLNAAISAAILMYERVRGGLR